VEESPPGDGFVSSPALGAEAGSTEPNAPERACVPKYSFWLAPGGAPLPSVFPCLGNPRLQGYPGFTPSNKQAGHAGGVTQTRPVHGGDHASEEADGARRRGAEAH
jgi:hypothetical protein